MPTPGFPDWLGPGAIVRERPDPTRDAIGNGVSVVMNIELQLEQGEGTQGAYAITIVPLNYDAQEIDFGADSGVINLSALLDLYDWTGEYLTPEGTIVSQGTTMPVTMFMRALQPMERIVLRGSPAHDGEYIVESIVHHTGTRNGFSLEVVAPDDVDWARPGLAQEQAQEMADMVGQIEDLVENAAVTHDPPLQTTPVLNETNVPIVAGDQVWMLPRPNHGLWRTSLHERGRIRLTHERERDRVMDSTATWLVEHGVRQTPPDPRTNQPGQGVVIGQVWEFRADAGSRYRRFPRWRVQEINAHADMVMLTDEGGSGKRIYLPPSRIMALATFVGDGLPRRTAYEHILEADD